jgi:hypothetical protein
MALSKATLPLVFAASILMAGYRAKRSIFHPKVESSLYRIGILMT